MSLIEKLESGEKLEFFDVTLTSDDDQPILAEVDGMQPLSSNQSKEIVSSICSRCKIEFKTDEELETHTDNEHNDFDNDDKEALRQTSELSAVLAAITDQCPEIMEVIGKEQSEVKPKESFLSKDTDDENKVRKINCHVCLFQADSERTLRMHMKNKHEAYKKSDKKFKCKACDFKTSSPTVMGVHVRKQHKEMYKCDECEKEFKTRGELAHHKRTHIAAFKCEKCFFKGTSHRSLTIHMNKNHLLDLTQQRGTKREQETQSPHDFVKPKLERKKEEPIKHLKKKAKQNDKTEISPKIKLPIHENQVVGGAGWSLPGSEFHKTKNETKYGKTKTKPKVPVKLTHLPNVVASTLPEHKDSILQLVLGDGACCMRSIAVHLGLDEEEGLDLSKQYNKYLSRNREIANRFISFPKTITVSTSTGKIEKSFDNTAEEKTRFFDYLLSDEAIRVWREGEDMIAISLYFNLQIEVVKILWSGEVELPTQKYGPDGDFQLVTEVKPKITLLNSADHFNLIVKSNQDKIEPTEHKDSEMYSNRKEVLLKCNFCEQTEHLTEKLDDHIYTKHSKEIITKLTEENIKLREIVKTQGMSKASTPPIPAPRSLSQPHKQKSQLTESIRSQENWRCDKCGNNFTNKPLLEAHTKNKHIESTTQLKQPSFRFSAILNCEICGKVYVTKVLLESHTQEHTQSKEGQQYFKRKCVQIL